MLWRLRLLRIWTCVSLACGGHVDGVACNTAYGVFNNSWTMTTPWQDMTKFQRASVVTCGYDQTTWNGPSGCFNGCWSDLSEEQQRAKLVFGTDAACSDQGSRLLGLSCVTPSSGLGVRRRPDGIRCDESNGLFNTSRAAFLPWAKFTPSLRKAAALCGFTRQLWDGPSQCRACFADLSPAKKLAALAMGTNRDCWDGYLKNYGVDCSKLLKGVQNASRRFAIYADLSKATLQEKVAIFRKVHAQNTPVVNVSQLPLMVYLVGLGLILVSFTALSAKGTRRDYAKDPVCVERAQEYSDGEFAPLLWVETAE